MSPSSSKPDFSKATDSDPEKARAYRIQSIKTQELREGLEQLTFKRDILLETKKDQHRAERQRIARYILEERVLPASWMELRPDRASELPDRERSQVIRDLVEQRFLPEHEKHVDELRSSINAEIDREIDAAVEFERSLPAEASMNPREYTTTMIASFESSTARLR